MSAFVLIPGAWLGAWAWEEVIAPLEKEGHAAYPVVLTGMGEKAAVSLEDVGMETAIQDVLEVIKTNDLENVVIVGHSFAGKVAAAVADRVPERVDRLIYLDGFTPEKIGTPQGSFPDEFPVEGLKVPFPEEFLRSAGKDVRGKDRERLLSNATACPVRYFRDPITLSKAFDSVREAYVYCRGGDTLSWLLSQASGNPGEDEALRRILRGPHRIIDSGHWPMITRPLELAESLMSLTR